MRNGMFCSQGSPTETLESMSLGFARSMRPWHSSSERNSSTSRMRGESEATQTWRALRSGSCGGSCGGSREVEGTSHAHAGDSYLDGWRASLTAGQLASYLDGWRASLTATLRRMGIRGKTSWPGCDAPGPCSTCACDDLGLSWRPGAGSSSWAGLMSTSSIGLLLTLEGALLGCCSSLPSSGSSSLVVGRATAALEGMRRSCPAAPSPPRYLPSWPGELCPSCSRADSAAAEGSREVAALSGACGRSQAPPSRCTSSMATASISPDWQLGG